MIDQYQTHNGPCGSCDEPSDSFERDGEHWVRCTSCLNYLTADTAEDAASLWKENQKERLEQRADLKDAQDDYQPFINYCGKVGS